MTVGIGVEGPSDLQFWNKVLPKHFRGHRFDVRNMKSREKLIRETPRLLDTFRSCGYGAAFILLDLDSDPCFSAVFDLFDKEIIRAARVEDRLAREIHICIAVKEIESWYLADQDAIGAVIEGCGWQAPVDTRTTAKGHVRSLIKATYGRRASFNEIALAKDIAPKFDPSRARNHSESFRYFWELIERRTGVR